MYMDTYLFIYVLSFYWHYCDVHINIAQEEFSKNKNFIPMYSKPIIRRDLENSI